MPEPTPLPPSLAEKPGRVLAFRVNRRPLGEGTLIPESPPQDAFDHFVRMLTPGYEVRTTGRGHDRSWKVGAVEVDDEQRFVMGKLGWHPVDPEIVPTWSEELKDWPPTLAQPVETLMPFVFDGDTRLLGVVHDKRSSPNTIAGVFEMILDRNERETSNPTTDWSVEPVLDSRQFIEWLHSQDVVESVAFTAKLPNPEPMPSFEDLYIRMQRAHGTEYTARMRSRREEGLQSIEEDPEFSQAIAMGQQGFAQLQGRGRRQGRKSRYAQSDRVASDIIPSMPANWEELRALLKEFVRARLSRFLLGAPQLELEPDAVDEDEGSS